MTFGFKITDATFTNYVDKSVPYLSEAIGFWLLGGDASCFDNLVPGNTDTPVITGTPIYGANYVQLNQSNWVNLGTSFTGTSSFTMIMVGDFARTGAQCGTLHSGSGGHYIWTSSATATLFAVASGATNVTASNARTAGAMQFAAAVREAGVETALYLNSTGSIVKTAGAATAGGTTNSFALHPGAMGVSGDTTYCKYTAAMLFSVAKSAAQIQEIYDYLDFKLGRRGVTMV